MKRKNGSSETILITFMGYGYVAAAVGILSLPVIFAFNGRIGSASRNEHEDLSTKILNRFDKNRDGLQSEEAISLARALGYDKPIEKSATLHSELKFDEQLTIYLSDSSTGWKDEYRVPLSRLQELVE